MTISTTEPFTGWLTPNAVFNGSTLQRNVSVYVSDGVIDRIQTPTTQGIPLNAVIAPGFFDLQVNGGGGVLFNNAPAPESLTTIARAHAQYGTTRLLPTLITDRPEVLQSAVECVIAASDAPGIAGIHIEGPHISAQKAGVHRKEYIRLLDNHTIGMLQSLRDHGIATLITLAPEAVNPGQIQQLVAMGVVVSLGHSNAGSHQVASCLEEGALLFTHLFNAMSPMTSREPGMVGTAINSSVYCSLICDGIHVCPDMIRLAMAARPRADRMIIVSDAMATVGGADQFTLYGETISLQHNRLVNRHGALAGAHTTMAASVALLHDVLGLPLEQCLSMAITHPASLMGQPHFHQLNGLALSQCIAIPEIIQRTTTLDSTLRALNTPSA